MGLRAENTRVAEAMLSETYHIFIVPSQHLNERHLFAVSSRPRYSRTKARSTPQCTKSLANYNTISLHDIFTREPNPLKTGLETTKGVARPARDNPGLKGKTQKGVRASRNPFPISNLGVA